MDPEGISSTYARAAWLFRRLLGLVYLFAFWSLATQVIGLIGHDGILPATDYMNQVREVVARNGIGAERFRLLPTLCWIGASDSFLRGLCAGGVVLALLLIAGVAPALVTPLLWIAYLSLSLVGQDFLSFQWDALLLETGFLAIFVSPLRIRDRLDDAPDPPAMMRWLFWILTLKLMVSSGVIKLASGDPTWRDLTAVSFHYETQPIPTPVAWYASALPLWFQRITTAAVISLESLAPFLIVLKRRGRIAAFVLLAALQVLIAVTGNYAFFNLVTVALLIWFLDDGALSFLARNAQAPAAPVPRATSLLRSAVVALVALVTLPVSGLQFARSFGVDLRVVPLVGDVARYVTPFRSVNSYGLFAVMTTTRPEIVVEGSEDGSNWQAYEFRYKAGDVNRRPPWIAPFQPRLDWQMWFAALGNFNEEEWFQAFCRRLLEGSPDVLARVEHDPFAGSPPRYLRARLYQYHFSNRSTREASGAWWTSELVGEYSPVMSRDQ
jgi:lipase maturation factor 1